METSPLKAGLLQKCPRCGKGPLYQGVLTVCEVCKECGLDLSARDPGDGPAFFVITVLGFLVVALALLVEVVYEPPFWVHAALWLPFTLIGSVLLLRVAKALLISYQYKHKIGFN